MIISIASGKGGTGKTLISTSLALSLKDAYKVRLLDCDVEEPNAHIFAKPVITAKSAVTIPVPVIDESKCTHLKKCAQICNFHAISVGKNNITVFPELCHGCGACSYICPERAIKETPKEIGVVEEGSGSGLSFSGGRLFIGQPMAPPIIREVKKHVYDEDYIIIDAPPGTSCPAIEAIKGSDFCALVTEPTPFGLNDLSLAVETVKLLGIPFGVILNKDGVGSSIIEDYCKLNEIPIIMRIPFDPKIAVLYSKGIPLTENFAKYKMGFLKLSKDIMEMANA